jgi:hypothetical protein
VRSRFAFAGSVVSFAPAKLIEINYASICVRNGSYGAPEVDPRRFAGADISARPRPRRGATANRERVKWPNVHRIAQGTTHAESDSSPMPLGLRAGAPLSARIQVPRRVGAH